MSSRTAALGDTPYPIQNFGLLRGTDAVIVTCCHTFFPVEATRGLTPEELRGSDRNIDNFGAINRRQAAWVANSTGGIILRPFRTAPCINHCNSDTALYYLVIMQWSLIFIDAIVAFVSTRFPSEGSRGFNPFRTAVPYVGTNHSNFE